MAAAPLRVRLAALLAAALVLVTATCADAWSNAGHMAVAYVAYGRLTPATRVRVQQLLRLNPDYRRWSRSLRNHTTRGDRARMLFMIASTWPDQIKHDPAYADDGSAGGDRPDGASSRRNVGYGDRLRHKYWHFVDTPFADDGTALPSVPRPNARTQIAAFRAVLASAQPDALKSYDLVWLVHLVGDVHQPLHCATRVDHLHVDGDAGGNDVAVRCAECFGSLHAFWDGAFDSDTATPSGVMRAAAALPAPDAALAASLNVDDWIAESVAAARRQVYVPPVRDGDGPFTLTPAYRSHARTLAATRVALAGARLANLLNTELR